MSTRYFFCGLVGATVTEITSTYLNQIVYVVRAAVSHLNVVVLEVTAAVPTVAKADASGYSAIRHRWMSTC